MAVEESSDSKIVYSIIDIDVKDPDEYKRYSEGYKESMEKYGGKVLVKGGQFEMIEGDRAPKRMVIQQWPSAERFKQWYNSEEYAPWKALRLKSAVANIILIEGV
jgi:uncharacterized protein (DUF1330 family)